MCEASSSLGEGREGEGEWKGGVGARREMVANALVEGLDVAGAGLG